MIKCWWCHVPETYAFGLCHACYRWYNRHSALDDSDYCSLCNKFITRRHKGGVCKECNLILKEVGKSPRRLELIEQKFEPIKPLLDKFDDKNSAFNALFSAFKPKQLKFLEAFLERYYDKVTLQAVADQWESSREYVRQCENKVLNILLKEVF